MTKIFGFSSVIDMLLKDHEKNRPILRYEKAFELTRKSLYDPNSYEWYTKYLCKLKYIPFELNENIDCEYDLKLLQQLLAGSSTHKTFLKPRNSGINYLFVSISEPGFGETMEFNISNLSAEKIKKIMCNLVNEQLNFSLLRSAGNSQSLIDGMREESIASWKKYVKEFYK
ncbi:MAG: hypothetical protein ACQEQF_12840 [Bacillota bacterium]